MAWSPVQIPALLEDGVDSLMIPSIYIQALNASDGLNQFITAWSSVQTQRGQPDETIKLHK